MSLRASKEYLWPAIEGCWVCMSRFRTPPAAGNELVIPLAWMAHLLYDNVERLVTKATPLIHDAGEGCELHELSQFAGRHNIPIVDNKACGLCSWARPWGHPRTG